MYTKPELLSNYESLILAITLDDQEKVEKLLAYGIDPSINNSYAFQLACANGVNNNIISMLLKHPKTNPKANDQYGFWMAAQNNRLETVRLLLTDENMDPSASKNKALVQACANGHESMVELLLTNQRVAQSITNNRPIILAVQNGHINIVKLLLEFPSIYEQQDWLKQVFPILMEQGNDFMSCYLLSNERLSHYKTIPDFSANNLPLACRYGLVDTVKILLQDPTAIKKKEYNTLSILSEAALNGQLKVVELLLNDEKVNPFEQHYEALCQAAKGGSLDVVKRLIMVPNMDRIYLNYALNYATMYGQLVIMNFLLNEQGVDPSFCNNQAIKFAHAYNQTEAIKLLMKDNRVTSSFTAWGASAINNSFFNKNREQVKSLLSNEQIRNQIDLIRPQFSDDQMKDFNEVCQDLMLPDQIALRKPQSNNKRIELSNEALFQFSMGCYADQTSTLPSFKPEVFKTIVNFYQQLPLVSKEPPPYIKRDGESRGFLPDGHIVVLAKPEYGNDYPIEIYHPINGLVKTFDPIENGKFISAFSDGTFLVTGQWSPLLYHPDKGLIGALEYCSNSTKASIELPNGNLATYSFDFSYGGWNNKGYCYSVINLDSVVRPDSDFNDDSKTSRSCSIKIERLSVLPNGYLLSTTMREKEKLRHGEWINKKCHFFRVHDFDHEEIESLGDYYEKECPEDIPRYGLTFS